MRKGRGGGSEGGERRKEWGRGEEGGVRERRGGSEQGKKEDEGVR